MSNNSVLPSVASEYEELEIVELALAKTPRLAKLLSYLARHYFEGSTDHLTEFHIATEVFGRDRHTFIASEDAIARVETHRLRKRLRLFYEGDGKQHPVQISIPHGTYVPVFLHQKRTTPPQVGAMAHLETITITVEPESNLIPPQVETENVTPPVSPNESSTQPQRWNQQRLLLGTVIVGALLCVLAVYSVMRWRDGRSPAIIISSSRSTARTSATGVAQSSSVTTTMSPSVAAMPFRMIAGYSGPPQKDAEGYLWQPDKYYHRGWPLHRFAAFIPRSNDPLIFQYGRAGDMDYDIPLRPGTYELHLYFMQPSETAQGEDAENKAIFNVAVNGKVILDNFDIVSDAMGRDIADERVFRDISPAEDGQLHLHFSTVLGTPSVSAIALFDGTPGKLLPIRIGTQPIPRTDHNGLSWQPDNYFIGGRHLSHNPPTEAVDIDMLSTERYGHFTYALPVDPRDEYTVSLYFVEQFFGTSESTGGGTGSRIFRVICNGNILLDNFDIFKEASTFHVVKKTFYHIRPTAQGKLNLTFEPIVNYATVSAIEAVDESR